MHSKLLLQAHPTIPDSLPRTHMHARRHTHTQKELKTTLKPASKLDGDSGVTRSRHTLVLCTEEGSSNSRSRVYFYTRSLTPPYISSQLLVRTEDMST